MTDSDPTPTQTPGWPVRIAWDDEEFPEIFFFDKPLYLQRRAGPSLELSRGTPETTRLAAIPKTSDNLSFLPSFGDRPFLIFPRPLLICPAGLRFSVDLAVPLYIQLSIEAEGKAHRLVEWAPNSVSRGAYGPVDNSQICTSFSSPSAGDPAELLNQNTDHPIVNLNLSLTSVDSEPMVYPCWARLNLKVVNTTNEPLEISKIMIPTASLSLFQAVGSSALATNKITMRLLGPQDAELVLGDPPGGKKLWDPILGRQPGANDRRPYVFLYAYKTKTGLEHGF